MNQFISRSALILLIATSGVQAADFSVADICKAAIAVEMGRETKTMKADAESGFTQISYRRPDGDKFKYRCQLEGDRVVWSTFLNDTKQWGRWRNSESMGDAITTYKVSGEMLVIESDQAYGKSFTKKDF